MSSKEKPQFPIRTGLWWLSLTLLVAVGGCVLAESQGTLTLGPDGAVFDGFVLQVYPDAVTAPAGTQAVVPIVISFVEVVVSSGDTSTRESNGSSSDDSSSDDSSSSCSSSDDSSSSCSSSDDSSSGDADCARICHCEITDLEPMEAFLLDVEFDTEHLVYNSTLRSGAMTGWFFHEGRLLSEGVVRLGGFTTPEGPIANPDTLGYIVFDVKPGASGKSFLETKHFEDELRGLPNSIGCIQH